MTIRAHRVAVVVGLLLQVIAPAAQGPAASIAPAVAPRFDSASLSALTWRNIGPFRGGRAVAATGVPQHPRTFYFGGVGGGVWKTTDGGENWTNITDGHAPDAAWDAVRAHFSEKELADLTWAIASINAWNRIAIAFRSEAGRYKPAGHG